jgi:hypothetical protein
MVRALLILSLTATPLFAQNAGPGASAPFLSASGNTLLLSWLEPVANTDRVALRFARMTDGKWSAARTIVERNDFFVNWADFPSIVADGRGVLYTHWLQKTGQGTYAYDVRMTVSRDGGQTWDESFVLNRDGKQTEHGFVSLAPIARGGVGAAWLDGRKMGGGHDEHGEMTVRYATIDSKGRITSDVELDARACECCATGLAMTSSGPVIVYRDRSADEIRDIAVVSLNTRPRPVHADGWKINGCPVNGPQIDAIDAVSAVAWFTAANDLPRVHVSFSTDGAKTFSKPIRIDEGKPLGRVDVLMMDRTTALATWVEQTSGGAEIRARLVRAGGVEPAVRIADSSPSRAAGFPRIARLGRDVWVAWTIPKKGIEVRKVTF